MAKPQQDTKYYATTKESSTDSTSGGKWLKESSEHDEDKVVALGGVSLVGANNEKYSCTYTITLTDENASSEETNLIKALSTGDLILNITGDSSTTVPEGTNYDLSTLNGSKTFTVNFELDSENDSKTFDANIYLVNKVDKQDTLPGKSLNLKFETEATCEIKEAAGD